MPNTAGGGGYGDLYGGSPSTWCSEFDCVDEQWYLYGAAAFGTVHPVIGRISRYFGAFVPSLGKVYKVSGQNPSGTGTTTATCEYQAVPVAAANPVGTACQGLVTRLDRVTRALYATTVQTCHLRVGRHGARCSVDWTPDGTTVDLRVTVTDAGHEIRVGRLEITGERSEDHDEVMRRVTFQEGALYTDDCARDLRARIESLGRYSRVRLTRPEDARGGRLDPFRVKVEIASFAPAIAATPWDALAQLQRGLAWLETALLRGHAMGIGLTMGDGRDFEIGQHITFGRGVLHLAADGASVGWDDVRWDGKRSALREWCCPATGCCWRYDRDTMAGRTPTAGYPSNSRCTPPWSTISWNSDTAGP